MREEAFPFRIFRRLIPYWSLPSVVQTSTLAPEAESKFEPLSESNPAAAARSAVNDSNFNRLQIYIQFPLAFGLNGKTAVTWHVQPALHKLKPALPAPQVSPTMTVGAGAGVFRQVQKPPAPD